MKSVLNKAELILQLQQQLIDIGEFCKQYDAGDRNIIATIAQKILLIFHNSDKSKSLINQLKLNQISMFCSSVDYDSKSLINFIGLLKLLHQSGSGWAYSAQLEDSVLVKVSLDNWWQNKKVIIDSDGVSFSRAKIIKAMAGLDLVSLNTDGWKLKTANGNLSIINPLPETVRQIAFEIIERFKSVDLNLESKLYYK